MNKLKTDKPRNYAVGRNLQRLRWENQLTQKALAELLGCSQSAVSMWEKGAFMPYGKTREKITLLYDLPSDFFSECE